MNATLNGIAHISFHGGGIFMPARTPYDRQLVAEHVADRVRTKGRVQVLIDDQRWMVHVNNGAVGAGCAGCGVALRAASCCAVGNDSVYCVRCVFDERPSRGSPRIDRTASEELTTDHRELPYACQPVAQLGR